MANTAEKTTPTAETPKTRGRVATRDPKGKSIAGFFSSDELEKINEARFVGRHDQLNDLVRVAVLERVEKLLSA